MSANEDDELCDLFKNGLDLRKMKTDFVRLDLSEAREDEDSEDKEKTMTSLPEMVSGMYSSNVTHIFTATKSLRRILTRDRNVSIETIVETGLVKPLVTFLGCDGEPLLQLEAACALINIAAGTSQQTHTVIQAGAVPQLIRLLASPHDGIVYYCVWALGNIIGGGAEFRDVVIEGGILTPLMRLVRMNAPPNFLRTVAWVISNLCRNKQPPPNLEIINACLWALRFLIRHTDYDVLSYTCWGFYFVVDVSRDLIQQVVKSPGVVSRLVELLGIPEPRVIIPALQTVGIIVNGDDSHTQAVIDCNVLQMLPALLQHSDVKIKELACWVLSNITFGSSEKIQAVINCNLVPLVVEVLNTGDIKSQYEATRVIIGLTRRGTLEQIIHIVQCGTLKSFCDLLTTDEIKLLNVLVDGIFSILKATNTFGQVEYLYVMLKEIGGLDKIEKLQDHTNFQVRYKSYNIIHKFFSRVCGKQGTGTGEPMQQW